MYIKLAHASYLVAGSRMSISLNLRRADWTGDSGNALQRFTVI